MVRCMFLARAFIFNFPWNFGAEVVRFVKRWFGPGNVALTAVKDMGLPTARAHREVGCDHRPDAFATHQDVTAMQRTHATVPLLQIKQLRGGSGSAGSS